jgi:hypothetical protein
MSLLAGFFSVDDILPLFSWRKTVVVLNRVFHRGRNRSWLGANVWFNEISEFWFLQAGCWPLLTLKIASDPDLDVGLVTRLKSCFGEIFSTASLRARSATAVNLNWQTKIHTDSVRVKDAV